LKPSFFKSNCFCISMPGTPKKVGKSADIVWVRSTTLLKLRCAVGWAWAGMPAAAKAAAVAPPKKPRRLSAR
jgi:hypothetical protein